MKEKAIIVDIDDCTLAYSARLREYVNMRYGRNITGLSQEWDVKEWLRLGDKDAVDLINEFADSWNFGTLEPMPGAVRVLNDLALSGYRILAVTACGTGEVRENLRLANLYHCFGPIFEEIVFVGLEESKRDSISRICDQYEVAAFVDDRISNLQHGTDLGVPCILFKQPHNKKDRYLMDTVVYDWYEIKHAILKE